jgi:tetratricopeptide (TPR) repeat protein
MPFIRLFIGDVLREEGQCDGLGNYTFELLESGVYTVHVTLPGFKETIEEIRVRPSGSRRVVVKLGEMEKEPFDPGSTEYWRAANSEAREEVTQARQLRMTGDPEGAIPFLERALEQDPQFPIAHGELGLCYMRLGRLDVARESLEAAIEYGPKSLTPYLNLAEVWRQQGNLTAAEEALLKASEIHPERGEPVYIQAQMKFDTGDLEGAIQSAQRALELDHSFFPQVHLLLADAYEQRGEIYRIPQELEAYLEKDPEGQDVGSVRAKLERVRRELESMEISLKEYSGLLERYRGGDFHDAATALSRIPWDETRKAIVFYKKDRLTDSDLVAAALLHTDTALIPGSQRSYHFSSAIGYLKEMEDEAYRQSIERHWFLTVAYYFQSIERSLIALPFLTQAAHLYPEDIEIKLALGTTCESAGWVYGYANLIDRAERVYRDILAAVPDHVEARLRLAHILKLTGVDYETLEGLTWVLAHTDHPDYLMVANLLLGDVQRARGSHQIAMQHYQKAVEIDPGCQAAATAMSHMLHLARDSVGSHQVLRQYLEGNDTPSGRTDGWWKYLLGHSDKFGEMMLQLRGELQQ